MRSVMSLADTTSSFEDRGLNDETDESDALNADDSKDTRDGETDSEYCFPDQVYLVGTAHFSRKSQMDVLRTIREVQPDFVMVELCPSRVSLLSMDEKTLLRETKQPTMEKLINIIKESGVIRGVLYILLLSMTAHVTKQLDVAPGGEMRAAYTYKVPQCRIVLGDRPVHITIQRAVGSLNLFQKIRFLYSLITSLNTKITSEDVERCKKADILEAFLDGVSEKFPPLSRILVDERDLYMVNTLQKVLRSTKYQPVKAVAVVGIGHVRGMVSKWGKRTSTAELLKIPEPSRAFKIIKYGFKGLIISLMVYGTYRCGSRIYNKIFAQK
uniref:TraB domain-containing protein n=1 Tax=Syphacia muris TaxID=451379 RepID=A0A0N5AM23_9BILA